MEVWKDIPGYEGYQISDLGRVRTKNKITYKNNIKRHWKDRILKPKIATNKYGRKDYRVDLWSNGKNKTVLISRLVAFTFFKKDINNKKLTVNHINGNSKDNRLVNLELISLKENIQHGFRTGLYKNMQKKVKITNKITGTIIYPSSLSEGSCLIGKNVGYISAQLIKNKFENEKYKWELIEEIL